MPDNISYTKVYNSYCEAFWKERKYLDYAQGLIDDINKVSTEKAIIWSHYPSKPRMLNDINMPYPVPHILSNNVLGVCVNLGPWIT